MRNRREHLSHTRRGGFTLLEVAVALAIFVIGAIAILRIFPPALGIIQSSGDRVAALNMNRGVLARLTSDSGRMPYAIVDLVSNPNQWNGNLEGAALGTSAARENSLPQKADADFDKYALGHFRRIIGEPAMVQEDLTASKLFVLTQFPVDPNDGQVSVYEEDDIVGATIDSNGTLDFSDATFASSGSKLADATYPRSPSQASPNYRTNCTYYVTYSYYTQQGIDPLTRRIWTVVDDPKQFDPAAIPYSDATWDTTGAYSGRVRGGLTTVLPGPVKVHLRRLMGTVSSSGEDAVCGYVADLGVLQRLIPNSATPTSTAAGDTVTLDYTRLDPRWLVHDDVPTPGSVYPLAPISYGDSTLPVRLLEPRPAVSQSLATINPLTTLLYDRGNSNTISNGRAINPNFTTGPANNLKEADFKVGRLTVDRGTMINPELRVVYRTRDEWAQQVTMAAQTYKPYQVGTDSSTPGEPYRDFALGTSDNYLYFHASEAGKSVYVSYTYGDSTGVAEGDVKVVDRVFNIETRTIEADASLVPNSFANSAAPPKDRLARVHLTDINGNPLGSNPGVTSIQAVRGASLQARTAWLYRDRFTQASTMTYREAK